EAAVRPRPWHADGLDAACVATHARHAGIQVGLMLEEVEVAPGFPLGVVGRAVCGTATRTSKAAARGKIDLDIEAMCVRVKVAAAHGPWRGQSQRQFSRVVLCMVNPPHS